MVANYSPAWQPEMLLPIESLELLISKYLSNKSYVLYGRGSFVLVQDTGSADVKRSTDQRLDLFTTTQPDFKVRRHAVGDFLVTFKGGIGGVAPGRQLGGCYESLRYLALSEGLLPSERIAGITSKADETDAIAGLYVRALLYQDAREKKLFSTSLQ